jgi:hypothetical protein
MSKPPRPLISHRPVAPRTLDDFDDDCLAKEDHDWLDDLTAQWAYQFAAENGYDLGDYANGEIVSDWWGFLTNVLIFCLSAIY